MPDPTTTNRSLYIPTRGSNVGTWDTPINSNFSAIDTLFGGVTSIAVSSSNVTLNTSQCQNAVIRLTGTLSANIDVIFPTVAAIYTVENLTTGAFYVRCKMASGNAIGVPQGVPTQVFTDGTDTKFWNPPMPGTYWDYAGDSVPAWITACTVLPWVSCDGSAVSRTTYAYLYSILGTTWGAGDGSTTFNLPDLRNRARVSVGGSRLTAGGSGIDGATVGSVGGVQTVTLAQANLPNSTLTISGSTNTTGDHQHNLLSALDANSGFSTITASNPIAFSRISGNAAGDYTLRSPPTTSTATIGQSSQNGNHSHTVTGTTSSINGNVAQTAANNTQPTAVAGITLIKT